MNKKMKKIKAVLTLILAPRLGNEKITFRSARPTSLIIGALFAAVAFTLPTVSFAATLNNDPQDFATLRVVNYTVNGSCVTCWGASATASAGDIVSFAIYYHNVGPDTAMNVRVKLSPQSTSLGTTHTFSAIVSADNAPAVSGTVGVTTNSNQTISFLDNGVLWRPNQTVYGSTSLPVGQFASNLFNGVGINLGNIASGWDTQGSLIVRFQTSPAGGAGTNGFVPTVTTNSANSVSQTSATLNGDETPNGASTDTWFQWGTTQSFGNTTSSVNYGTTATSFSSALSGLNPNTTYYYRAVAQNAQGGVQGSTLSFTTSGVSSVQSQPTINTQSATNISGDYAVLNGYVDPNGTSDTMRWFEWGTNSYAGNQNQTAHYTQGVSAGNFSANLSGLSQNVTYYYRAVAQNSQGTVYGATYSFATSNTGNNNSCGSWGWGGNCGNSIVMVSTRNADTSSDFAVLNGYVDPNGTNDTTRWFEWGGSQSFGNSTQKLAQGNVASNFSASLTSLVPNTTYYYRAAARNSQGTVYGNPLSFTTGGQTTGVIGSSPAATTLIATDLTGTTAKLNGLVSTSANQASNAWFEWGTNSSLSNKTQTVNVGALPVIKQSDVITGLTSGQTYYYRIVAENPYGKVYGSINNFVSSGTPVVQNTTVVVRQTPKTVAVKPATVVVVGKASQDLVSLSIQGGEEMIGSGEKRTYRITWKNESTQALKNVVLRATFPSSMNVDSATMGSFSGADNSVIIDLKTLASKEGGDAFIFATTGRGLKSGELLVVTANMVYTGANGVQGDAIAYMTHRAEAVQSALGANAFGAGEFIPTTLFEWVLLMILVLALVLLGNHLYGRLSGVTGH